jgi:DNA-binding MarR family transcriptional regulator
MQLHLLYMPIHLFDKIDAVAFMRMAAMPERPPSDAVIRAWTRLIRAQQTVLSAVEDELESAGFPPLGWYDVLLELSRSDHGLRPFVLEQQLLLAQYNLSRLLDRLEKAGYVQRKICPEDGRGQVVALTSSGRALIKRMWPAYRAAIARHVGARLAEDEAVRLGSLLGKLVGSRT